MHDMSVKRLLSIGGVIAGVGAIAIAPGFIGPGSDATQFAAYEGVSMMDMTPPQIRSAIVDRLLECGTEIPANQVKADLRHECYAVKVHYLREDGFTVEEIEGALGISSQHGLAPN